MKQITKILIILILVPYFSQSQINNNIFTPFPFNAIEENDLREAIQNGAKILKYKGFSEIPELDFNGVIFFTDPYYEKIFNNSNGVPGIARKFPLFISNGRFITPNINAPAKNIIKDAIVNQFSVYKEDAIIDEFFIINYKDNKGEYSLYLGFFKSDYDNKINKIPSNRYKDLSKIPFVNEIDNDAINELETIGSRYLKFLGYKNMESLNLLGARIFSDNSQLKKLFYDQNFSKLKNGNIALLPKIDKEGEVMIEKNIESKSFNFEKLGYMFSTFENYEMSKQNIVKDTFLIFNSRSENSRTNTVDRIYYAMLKSDYDNQAENLKIENKLIEEKEKNYKEVTDYLGKFKEKIFPTDSIFIIGLGVSNKEYLEWIKNAAYNKKTFKETFFAISNTTDLDFISKEIKNKNLDDWRGFPVIEEGDYIDSIWLYKSIAAGNLSLDSNTIVFKKLITKTYWPYDIEEWTPIRDGDKSKITIQKKLKYWEDKFNNLNKDFDGIKVTETKFNVSLKAVKNILAVKGHSEYEWQKTKINLENGLFFEINEQRRLKTNEETEYDTLTNYISIFSKINEDQFKYFNKTYDSRIDNPDFKFVTFLNFRKKRENVNENLFLDKFTLHSKDTYDGGKTYESTRYFLDGEYLNSFLALSGYYKFKEKLKTIETEEKEEEKDRKQIESLYPKYGKKFVDASIERNIIVGMHEDLLPYPLQLWEIKSRSTFNGGYTLYCSSMIDVSKKLTIRVTNKKVSYVSW